MSTDSKPIPMTAVPNCTCKHKAPPLGTNTTCPYAPPYTCGGPTYCGFCRANAPKTAPAPLEPESIVGWVATPDGIHEVATSGDRPIPTIPRESTPERRPINQALYRCCEILSDAIQSGQWRDKEEALECWRLLRGDVERHIATDDKDRRELVAWVAEMTKQEPRIEFDEAFLNEMVKRCDKVFAGGAIAWMLATNEDRRNVVSILAEQCARAAKVTGWREREQA